MSATVITFALTSSQLPSLKKVLTEHVAADKPILCLGTTSAFQVGDHESVVDETTPMTGISITGASLADRTEAENWMLSKGATVLHLSGIVGDKEESDASYGEPCSVGSFFQKGYARNGLKLINLIHVKDILNVINLFLEDDGQAKAIKGERIILSCGAFRLQDLAKGLGVDPLPENPPPDETMKGSKIISIAKLCSLLPADYEWTLPVPGVEPASRGIATEGPLTYYPNYAARNRQWELMKCYLKGKWQGTAMWYEAQDHSTFVQSLKNEKLPSPSSLVPSEYHIYFIDADTGIWHGKGLRFAPGGKKILNISRKTTNNLGKSFMFGGAAGQCSVDFKSGLFGAELNFFYERSRSMIIPIYKPDSTSSKFLLDTLCVVPFRCGYGHNFPLKPPQSEV